MKGIYVLFPASGCLDDRRNFGVTDELFVNDVTRVEVTNRETAIRTTPEIFWAFHEDRQVDSREDECETQDFY
ncbi:hypothetical protein TNCV_593641 [Trichonephila clavipes]|nr:hypothetical protein TNCV_593641 [Trichonephila clavipes]